MNIFTAVGAMLNSLTAVVSESGKALESTARTVRKTVEIAEISVDQMAAEQRSEIEALKADIQAKNK